MKALFLVVVFLFMLTGIVHLYRYSNLFNNILVTMVYLTGFLGLHSIYSMTQYKKKWKQGLSFLIGALLLSMSYYLLETELPFAGR